MASTSGFLSALALLPLFYLIYILIYRLYLSPIAKFPGPKLAAITGLYESYFDLIKGGQYVKEIRRLHEKYGPIIRINPWELHINDPDFFDAIYAGAGARRDKYKYGVMGLPLSALGTISHTLHRQRRAPLNQFFSKSNVHRLEPLIQANAEKLCTRLKVHQASGEPVTISHAYSCFAYDVVDEYSFGTSHNSIELAKDFRPEVCSAMMRVQMTFHFKKHLPWLARCLENLPLFLLKLVSPDILPLFQYSNDVENQIRSIMNGQATDRKAEGRPTIFHDILETSTQGGEKTLERLSQEAFSITGAGTETTAWTLSVMTYHLLNEHPLLRQLQEELANEANLAKAEIVPLARLEKLTFMTAVIKEGLRLSYGVSMHSPRISPDDPIPFKKWIIPAGTPVSMTSVLLHQNPITFPSPKSFSPNRWINPSTNTIRTDLERYLVAFNRGSRQCLGMNLAYAELYICLAKIVTSFPDMKLYKTDDSDVEFASDYFAPHPKADSLGVRVIL